MWPPYLLLSESIKYSQSCFFDSRERASSQFSLSARGIKEFYAQPFSLRFKAEIRLAVRKQLFFVKSGGWCNFNFKDVLNELSLDDW